MEVVAQFGGIAGLAGLGLGICLIIFRDIISKSIFASFTKKQSYDIIRLIIILIWSLAVIAVLAWLVSTNTQDHKKDRSEIIEITKSRQILAESWLDSNAGLSETELAAFKALYTKLYDAVEAEQDALAFELREQIQSTWDSHYLLLCGPFPQSSGEINCSLPRTMAFAPETNILPCEEGGPCVG